MVQLWSLRQNIIGSTKSMAQHEVTPIGMFYKVTNNDF